MCSEEVTVQSVGLPVDGPSGPVEGAIVLRERHQDGTTEDKTFAPGYGEFLTGGDGDLEATVLVVPHDALGGPAPAELDTLAAGATGLLRVTPAGDWAVTPSTFAGMTSAWDAYRGSAVPAMLDTRMTNVLDALTPAAAARDGARIQEAAIVVAQAALDLQLRYLAPIDVDTARFNLWTSRIEADGAAGDPSAVAGDVATPGWIWDRIAQTVAPGTADRIDARLGELRTMVETGDLAAELRGSLAGQ